MRPASFQKAEKIDPNADYPCPCRHQGRLKSIALTDAFGCNRCQQIFVLEESRTVIEELSTGYFPKRTWNWTGHRWLAVPAKSKEKRLPIVVGLILLGIVVLGSTLVINMSSGGQFFLCALIALLALTGLVWLLSQH